MFTIIGRQCKQETDGEKNVNYYKPHSKNNCWQYSNVCLICPREHGLILMLYLWHKQLNSIRPFSRLTQVSWYQNAAILNFAEAKDDGSGGDSWCYTTCKAPIKLSPLTNQNQHPTFYRLIVLVSSNQRRQITERKKYHIRWTCSPQAHTGVFQHCLWPLLGSWSSGLMPVLHIQKSIKFQSLYKYT